MKRKRGRPAKFMKRQRTDGTPNLRPNAIIEFFKYYKQENPKPLSKNDIILQCLFVNKKFCDAIQKINDLYVNLYVSFQANPNGFNHADYAPTKNLFLIKWNKENENLDKLLYLLKFVGYQTVKLYFETTHMDKNLAKKLIQKFAYVCRGFKDIPSLQKIHVNIEESMHLTYPIFIDLLPLNKKIYIETPHNISSLVKARKEPLELVEFYGIKENKLTAQFFKTKTKKLFFNSIDYYLSTCIPKLHDLRKIGPFPTNNSLQQLEMSVDLMMKKSNPNKTNCVEEQEWDNKILPQNKMALEYLKGVNENLTLELNTEEKMGVDSVYKAISFHEHQLQRAKSLIDTVQQIGLKIQTFSIKTTFDAPSSNEAQRIRRNFMEQTQMKTTEVKVCEFMAMDWDGENRAKKRGLLI